MAYVAVAKALYDYQPQDPDTELAFHEDHILYIIDKEDDDWWKAKLKDDAGGADGQVGLVPATYVEEIPPMSTTRAMFAYESTSPEELSMSDESALHVYSIEDDWLLVRLDSDPSSKLGFVPRNYCEPLDESEQVQVADAADTEAELEAQRQAQRERELAEKQRQLKLKDKVETWSISELDGKKKKKGTLGVGNAAVFFASDTDKAAPVKQYPITDVLSVSQPSSKTLSLSLSTLAEPLQFHCGSSDTAYAILAKLEQSKAAAGEALELLNEEQAHAASSEDEAAEPEPEPEAEAEAVAQPEPKRAAQPAFTPLPPPSHPSRAISAASATSNNSEPKGVRFAEPEQPSQPGQENEAATVLYDFDAAGDDELTVKENDTVTIVDKENDEWWLVKDTSGQQGVVPAAYLQLHDGSVPAPSVSAAEQDDEEERGAQAEAQARAAQQESERQRQLAAAEEERRRIQAAAETRRMQEEEDRQLAFQIEEEQRERAARKALRRQEEERRRREEEAKAARENARAGGLQPPQITKRPSGNDVAAAANRLPTRGHAAPARPPENARSKPNPAKIRTWSDKSGQFDVEAEYLGLMNGKVRLHKLNGVIIDVPLEKMSARDTELIRRHEAKKARKANMDEDDRPLSQQQQQQPTTGRRPGQRSIESTYRSEEPIPADIVRASKAAAANRRPPFDWFEFFLSAGCDMDDCTRYASNFERDRIDDSILSDLDNGTLRSLGLREGDVIRVCKVIQARFSKKTPEQQAQIEKDEELARQLQEQETSGKAPGLFTGPDGKLANHTRRGRPEKKSVGPESVDAAALAAASDKLAQVSLVPTPPSVPTPPPPVVLTPTPILEEKKPTAPTALSGFDDDAWTIKPISKPASPAPATITTNSSPAPSAPAAVSTSSSKVANNTDSLLAQINALRPASADVSRNNTGGSFDKFSQMASSPHAPPPPPSSSAPAQPQSQLSPQPTAQSQQSFAPNAYGLGVQNSGRPMSMLAQQTGMSTMSNSSNAPRGPLAPVPANQGLLNPMQPQATGMFVPTRDLSPMGAQQTGFQSQQPQLTGFQPQQQQQMMPQQTGFYPGQMGMQPNFTGFPQQQQQQSTFNAIASIPPPQPQQSQQAAPDKFAPSNIFAAMKKTDFGKPEEQQPQAAGKYDALRPLTTGYNGAPGMMPQQTGMMAQPTGMMPQQTGMMGMQGQGMPGMMPQMTGYNPMMYQNQTGYGYR
ncbi:hypothetical protein I309_04430 [Cryptococcus deuterogattii LA55]|nr:hypothetical protein I309_04430 [Cryptococcus deuterogattii LA55]KIR93727.1 hypothetical protein I304_02402 [Cryptococcus deuterogattii CBS 10090]